MRCGEGFQCSLFVVGPRVMKRTCKFICLDYCYSWFPFTLSAPPVHFVLVRFKHYLVYITCDHYLKFVVAFTRGVSCVVWKYFPLFVGKCIPYTHPFAIYVPGSFSLIGRAPSTPREPCKRRKELFSIFIGLLFLHLTYELKIRLGSILLWLVEIHSCKVPCANSLFL